MKKLDFRVIKGEAQFLENYKLSDKVAQIGDALLRENGLKPVLFGEDRRNERVWEAGRDKPDRKILKKGREIALLDWKGKTKDDWMINERAYNGYLESGTELGLPVYVAIWSFKSGYGKFIKLPAGKVRKGKEWDKNAVVVFGVSEMRPWSDLATELNSL